MNQFSKKDNWLRHRVNTLMKEKHKELFEPFYKSFARDFRNFISDSKQWWFVFLSVLLLFLISLIINLDILNVLTINHHTAIYIVDQRTTNIATIISITLVVVGFILNNLAVKNPHVYGLLFKKSFLYPITYLTLTVIGFFIVVSTLRDTLPPFIFTRSVLTGTYLSILILFLIGLLFRTVFLFSNEKEINKMLEEELLIEAKDNTKRFLLKKYSTEMFVSLMNEKGAKEYDLNEALENDHDSIIEVKDVSAKYILPKQQKEKIIHDINMNCISDFFSNKNATEQIFYRKLSLEASTDAANDIIWENNTPNTRKEKKKMLHGLVLKNNPKKEKDGEAMRKFFDQKLEQLSEQDKYRNLELDRLK
jgi:hypothetical protein